MRTRIIPLFVAGWMILAGCTTPAGTLTKSPEEASPSAPATAPDLDAAARLRALDVCSLIPRADLIRAFALAGLGEPFVSTPRLSMDLGICGVAVGSGRNYYFASLSETPAPAPGTRPAGVFTEERNERGVVTSRACPAAGQPGTGSLAYLTAPDGRVFQVQGGIVEADARSVCLAGVEIAKVLRDNLTAARSITWPKTSLAAIDLCTVLDPAIAAAGGTGTRAAPDRRNCSFELAGQRIAVKVRALRGADLRSRQSVLAEGLQARLSDDVDTCRIGFDHGPQAELGRRVPGRVEVLELEVMQAGNCPDLLPLAGRLATSVHAVSPFPS